MRTKAYKALTALVATEAAGVGTAMLDGSLTWAEMIVATGAALVTAAAVWRVPNPPKGPQGGQGVGQFL
jgi:hypothetical protein